MCVIIIKTAGHKLPSKRELKAAYLRNHDGCGFVSKTAHYKSLDFEDFYSHLKKVPQDENCIIHFRWATHGSVNIGNCHPFYDKSTETWFMHNGVLPILPLKGKTDSETAFKRYLVPTIKKYGLYSKELKDVVSRFIGSSRFALMWHGNIRTFGRYYEYGDCFYSNLNHINVPRWCAL